MIANTAIETITQFGVMVALAVFVIVLLMLSTSGTSIGRFFLPRSVTDNEVSLQAVLESFDRPDDDEWREAIRTAMAHGRDDETTTLGRGSLVLEIFDSQTTEVIWRAAAISDMLVDVDDAEKERRTSVAISEMLRRFPPSRV